MPLLRKRFYFDEFYAWLIGATQELLANISRLHRSLDSRRRRRPRGRAARPGAFGSLLRLFQVGNLQAYAFLFGLGIVGLIYFTVFR